LEDQNQKYFLGSKQDKQTNQAVVARLRGAKRASPKNLASRLPAFLLIPARLLGFRRRLAAHALRQAERRTGDG
jgi:hypothetical protein